MCPIMTSQYRQESREKRLADKAPGETRVLQALQALVPDDPNLEEQEGTPFGV